VGYPLARRRPNTGGGTGERERELVGGYIKRSSRGEGENG
jgi:hypothetical protein